MIAVFAGLAALAAIGEDSMPADTHAVLASHSDWLNTSRPLTADDFRGRIVLIDFWTYCCINCMHVIPDLHYLEEKFGDKLTVVGVHSAKFENERDTSHIRDAILRYNIAHPVVNDADFGIWKRFGVRAWPTFVLLAPEGNVAGVWSGEGNRDAVEAVVEKLVARYGAKLNTSPLPMALEKDKQPETALKFPGKLAYVPDFRGHPALLVSDSGHNRIVAMTPEGAVLETVGSGQAGRADGDFAQAQFRHPQGLAYQNGVAYMADTENHALRKIDFAARTVITLAGTGEQGFARRLNDAPAKTTALSSPWDVAFFPDEQHLAIAMAGTHQIWSYDISAQTLSVLAGSGREDIDDGSALGASLAQTSGLSAQGGRLYFVDSETSSLRYYENGEVHTLIGSGLFDFGLKDGKQGTARLQHPLGLFAGENGIYVADSYNQALRFFDLKTGELSTLAAGLHEPNDVVRVGDALYIADTNAHAIRVFDLKTKAMKTLEVHAPVKAAANVGPALSDNLPNVEKLPPQPLAENAELVLQLQPGWHINAEAPSSATLFNVDGPPRAEANFGRVSLAKGKVPLALLPGHKYRLQGTFYYCADAAGSQCLIKSVDAELRTAQDGKKSLAVELK